MNGNWSQQGHDLQTSAPQGLRRRSALTAFWAMVTVGRILFAAIVRWMPARIVFHLLPIVLVGTFTLTAALPDDTPWLGVSAVFGLAGLGCSALLPLTISLGRRLVTMSAAVAGGVIAFYQVGYGIAAFGVGPLVDRGVSLASLYGWTAIAAQPWRCCPSRSQHVKPLRGSCIHGLRATNSQQIREARPMNLEQVARRQTTVG